MNNNKFLLQKFEIAIILIYKENYILYKFSSKAPYKSSLTCW